MISKKVFYTIEGTIIALIIGFVNYKLNYSPIYLLLFLLPVSFVTWKINAIAGVVLASFCFLYSLINHAVDMSLRVFSEQIIVFGFLIIFVYLLNRLLAILHREKIYSKIDFVTGQPSEEAFYDLLVVEIKRAARNKYPITISYLIIDDFNSLSEKLGKNKTGQLLKIISGVLKESIRVTDFLFRLKGGDFVMLMPELGTIQVKMVVGKLHNKLSEKPIFKKMGILFSMGIITTEKPPAKPHELLVFSDRLMFSVRQSGKNTVKYAIF